MADQEAAAPRGADPSVASLPGVENVPGVEGIPGVVSDSQGAQTVCAQSGTGARDEWQPSDFRFVHAVADDVMSTGSRATLAKLYDRASAVTPPIAGGNVVSRRGHVDPRVPRSHVEGPSRAPLLFERPHSVDTLRVDREVSLLTEPMVSRPVPIRLREGIVLFAQRHVTLECHKCLACRW